MTLNFEWFRCTDTKRMEEALRIRREVFEQEQGFSGQWNCDDKDEIAWHVIGRDASGKAVCTARIFRKSSSVQYAGRIAVLRELRGYGIGRILMEKICAKAKELGAELLELGAQFDKKDFYRAVGFELYGRPFYDGNHLHIGVRKQL